jgi:hypothetical protein
LPLRSTVLAAAREWGVPPWEIMRGPAAWLMRWTQEAALRAEVADVETFADDGD